MHVIGDWLVFLPYIYLSEAIQDTADSYEQSFERYYGLSGNEPSEELDVPLETVTSLRQLSEKLFHGATGLVRPTAVPQEQLDLLREAEEQLQTLEAILDDYEREHGVDLRTDGQLWPILKPQDLNSPDGQLHFLLMCFELAAFDSVAPELHSIARRMLQLVQVMIRNPGEQTRAYLSRAARCYLFDLDAEFAVMARATLEQRIQEVMDDEEVEKLVGSSRSGQVTLERRIEACVATGIFDSASQRAAENIRASGNDAVHLSPSLVGSPDDLLRDLETVLRALAKAISE